MRAAERVARLEADTPTASRSACGYVGYRVLAEALGLRPVLKRTAFEAMGWPDPETDPAAHDHAVFERLVASAYAD